MEDTLTHELVHMYDHCRFKVDWNNLRHHACSEVSLPYCSVYFVESALVDTDAKIRANSLSGDCKFTREIQRGFLAFSKQHQVRIACRYLVCALA